jgi:hypothetical protein
VCGLPTNEIIKGYFYQQLKIKGADLGREVLQTLKQCVDELHGFVTDTGEDLEPQSTQESANDFDDVCTNIKNVYDALVACACETPHIQEIHETRLQLATKLKQEELHNHYSLNILIPGVNCLCPNEVHFLVSEKQRSVNALNVSTCSTPYSHTNVSI